MHHAPAIQCTCIIWWTNRSQCLKVPEAGGPQTFWSNINEQLLVIIGCYIFGDRNIYAVLQAKKYSWEYILSEILIQICCSLKGFLDTHMVERSAKLCWTFLLLLLSPPADLQLIGLVERWVDQIFCLILIGLIIKHSWANHTFITFSSWNCFSLQELSLACQPGTLKVIKNLKHQNWSKTWNIESDQKFHL